MFREGRHYRVFGYCVHLLIYFVLKMEATIVNFTKAVWKKGHFLLIGILFNAITGTHGYNMEDYCSRELSFITKTEYQIKLALHDNNLIEAKDRYYPYNIMGYCHTVIEAWITRYPKFMFYFDDLDLNCDEGHLEFYIGESSNTRVSGLESDICGAVKPQGVYLVDDRYFQIKYVPKQSQYISRIFSIIITSYGDEDSCPSYAHLCRNKRCIDDELACNGFNSCGDGSGCELSSGSVVGIVLGSLVAVALVVSVVICCICCTRRSRGRPGMVQAPATQYQQTNSQPMYGINQGPPYNQSQFSYPVATAPNIAATASVQQGYTRPTYGFNQGTNYSNNQPSYPTAPSNPESSQQISDTKNSGAPPQYSELFGNT